MAIRVSDRARWPVAGAVAVLALVLALLVDHPTERWVSTHRASGWISLFRTATHLGDPGPAFVLGLVLAGFAAFRSARVALAVAAVTLLRPLVSNVVKDVVGRPRPQLSQLVHAAGDAFPSGHTLAAVVLWGSLPAVMIAWRTGRDLVRLATAVAVLVVLVVGLSRVYLGVHWVSDVVGGALLGSALLLVVYRALPRS